MHVTIDTSTAPDMWGGDGMLGASAEPVHAAPPLAVKKQGTEPISPRLVANERA